MSCFLQQQSACERVIKRDIARTFPEHPRFQQENGQGQQGLFNVIKVIFVAVWPAALYTSKGNEFVHEAYLIR